jgi:hypothetical protein
MQGIDVSGKAQDIVGDGPTLFFRQVLSDGRAAPFRPVLMVRKISVTSGPDLNIPLVKSLPLPSRLESAYLVRRRADLRAGIGSGRAWPGFLYRVP